MTRKALSNSPAFGPLFNSNSLSDTIFSIVCCSSLSIVRIRSLLKADERPSDVMNTAVAAGAQDVRPKTAGQKRYVDAIQTTPSPSGSVPPGTGKSYLAVALAVQALQAKEINRIILTRPGGRGGRAARLPPRRHARQGRPLPPPALRRALRHARAGGRGPADGAGHDRGRAARVHAGPHAQRLVHHPRRGAEHHAEQMKMFLTRLGLRVQDGRHRRRDPDRPARGPGRGPGSCWCATSSTVSTGLAFVELDGRDVVRHRIVQDIVDAYERHEE